MGDVPLHRGPGGGGVAAAPQKGADRAGVQVVRVGAQGDLAGAVLPLPDGDSGLDPLHLAHKGGDVLRVPLVRLEGVHHMEADGGDGDFTAVVELQGLGEHALQPQPLEALGAEVALVQLRRGDAGVHEGGGHPVGAGGGVPVHEAAAVGGHGHIEGEGDLPGDGGDSPENVVHQLAAGGPPGVQAGILGEKLLGGVVVNGQVYPLQILLGVVREQPPGGHIHRHHGLRTKILRGQQALQIGGEQGGGLRVGEHMGGLAQVPQTPAQGGGAAHRVPVRAHVGEDQIAVVVFEKFSGLLNGEVHSSSSSWSSP